MNQTSIRTALSVAALSAALFAPTAFAAEDDGAPGKIAESADKVHPLLVGSTAPSVEVRNLDGETKDLKDLLLDKKSVLIFYRGGW